VGVVREIYRGLLREDVFMLAASIAYAGVMSLFPLFVGLIVLLSLFVERGNAQQAVVSALTPYVPPAALTMMQHALTAVAPVRGTGGIVAAVGLVWGATALASAIEYSLNHVLQVRGTRPFWRRKLVELAMVMLAGGFMSISLFVNAAAAALGILAPLVAAADFFRSIHALVTATAFASWIFSGLTFLIVYRFLPNIRLSRRTLLIGSLTGLLLFEGIKSAFFWYLRTLASYPLIYGPLVGVVVFMAWVYLAALVLLIGAEVMIQIPDQRPGAADALERPVSAT
jgi:membrane protein